VPNVTQAVLVTGASTGIGRKVTECLSQRCLVYAGARKDHDLAALARIRNVFPLRLDVTNASDITAAVRTVKENSGGLYGLINNAGVATLGSVLGGDDAEFDLVMAVNVRGPYCVTRAFAPLVQAERGRIVTIGSIAGVLAPANLSVYSMSKHAVEAFTDSLAEELGPRGVCVSLIEAGRFQTDLVRNTIARLGENPGLPDLRTYADPDAVVGAVVSALFDASPKRRYLVVSSQGEAYATISKQIAQLVQLNERHPYSYDRNAVVQMLDEALAHANPR
jgi:NAD(P)-dependent dehydrogenase (short-subunit alcohol dehydrogenase family)